MKGAASVILIKFKDFFDFKTHFAWMTRSNGYGGFVFRWEDYFNYYYICFSSKDIIMGKLVHGKHQIIHRKEKVFHTDQWYRFWLIAK